MADRLQYDKLSLHVKEAVRTLKTNIMFSSVDKPIKTVLLTSCDASAGKSTINYLLGISLAEAGKKTLIVDADLRRPNLGNLLGDRYKVGLSNVLMGESLLELVVHATIHPNLFFVDAGTLPPNPVEMIGSQQFKRFMEAAAQQFDIVIYDMSPVGMFIESALVAKEADGVVLVIGQGDVDYRAAQDARKQLELAQAKILGVVLNKVKRQTKTGSYYSNYYGDYYGYYNEEGSRKERKRGKRARKK